MGIMTIDGRKVEFTDERNVLTVIRKAGIDIPTLCYHSELSTFGACRLCTVEDDRGKTFASCSEEPRDGMVIYTNTAEAEAVPQDDYRAAACGALQRLHDLYQERRLQSSVAGASFWRDKSALPELQRGGTVGYKLSVDRTGSE